MSTPQSEVDIFRTIRRRLAANRLLDAPSLDLVALVSRSTGFVLSWTWLMTSQGLWMVLASVFTGFFAVQLGGLGHDAGHFSLTRGRTGNLLAGVLFLTVVNGIGFVCWCRGHAKHHSHTQQLGRDPDLEFKSVTAVDHEQRQTRAAWVHRFQGFYLPLLIPLFVWRKRVDSLRFVLGSGNGVWLDRAGLLGFVLLWCVLPLCWANWDRVLVANLACSCVVSIYVFMTFSINHVGMPLTNESHPRLHRQIEHTRNIAVPAYLDFVFNGLNFHIEHHLFPTVPMRRLRACQSVVREVCETQGIHYRERAYGTALREVFGHVWRIGVELSDKRQRGR